jgi:hypothetical protein
MRLFFTLLLFLAGLVMVVKAVSSQRTKGKLNIGDPIPAVTTEDQAGNQVSLASVGYRVVWMDAHASTDKQARDVWEVLAQQS